MTHRPVLYLDVDGPLNPYAGEPERLPGGYVLHRMMPERWIAQHRRKPRSYVKPLCVRLNPEHGRLLLELGEQCDLVWATTWGREANTFIAPVLGLPELPVVDVPVEHDGLESTSGKTPYVVAHAALPTLGLTRWAVNWADASRRCP